LIENIKKIKHELAENKKVLTVLEEDYRINEPKRLAEFKKTEKLRIELMGN
jgi:hypothetical protein